MKSTLFAALIASALLLAPTSAEAKKKPGDRTTAKQTFATRCEDGSTRTHTQFYKVTRKGKTIRVYAKQEFPCPKVYVPSGQ